MRSWGKAGGMGKEGVSRKKVSTRVQGYVEVTQDRTVWGVPIDITEAGGGRLDCSGLTFGQR